MTLEGYTQKIDRSNCPKCEFRNRTDLPIVMIPPPSKIKLVIISRDPTIGFKPIYAYSQKYEQEDQRRMLFLSAIPINLINKIIVFMEKKYEKAFNKDNKKFLFDTVINNAYWTHLHKCPTDFENNPFKNMRRKKNREKSMICANKWLENEIEKAIDEGAQAIIALGKDVQNWIIQQNKYKKWKDKIIKLPHPSGRNDDLWYRSPKTKKKIEECEDNIINLLNIFGKNIEK